VVERDGEYLVRGQKYAAIGPFSFDAAAYARCLEGGLASLREAGSAKPSRGVTQDGSMGSGE
jgi:hypothetical protein